MILFLGSCQTTNNIVIPDVAFINSVKLITDNGTGSGFYVNQNTILTAYHVHSSENITNVVVTNNIYDLDNDWSILSVHSNYNVSMIDYRKPEVGDILYYFGFPYDKNSLYSGICQLTFWNNNKFYCNGFGAPGMSGGAFLSKYNGIFYYSGLITSLITTDENTNDSLGVLVGVYPNL